MNATVSEPLTRSLGARIQYFNRHLRRLYSSHGSRHASDYATISRASTIVASGLYAVRGGMEVVTGGGGEGGVGGGRAWGRELRGQERRGGGGEARVPTEKRRFMT